MDTGVRVKWGEDGGRDMRQMTPGPGLEPASAATIGLPIHMVRARGLVHLAIRRLVRVQFEHRIGGIMGTTQGSAKGIKKIQKARK